MQGLVSTQYKASIDFCIFPCSRDKDKHKLQRVQGNDEVPFHFNVRELTAFPYKDVLFVLKKVDFTPMFSNPFDYGCSKCHFYVCDISSVYKMNVLL